MDETEHPSPGNREDSSGRWTVLAMFGFAVVMVLGMFVYWELYTRPFRPLQQAIMDAFPGAMPQVIGGRHKSRADAPLTLRIVLRFPADRLAGEQFDPENDEQNHQFALQLANLSLDQPEVEGYEILEIFLVKNEPEETDEHWQEIHSLEEWRKVIAESPLSKTEE